MKQLDHDLCGPTKTIGIVSNLVEQSLLSCSKFVDTCYISIYDENEVNIYDSHITKIVVSEVAVLNGWQCPITELWRNPIKANICDLKQDTLVLARNPSILCILSQLPKRSATI